MKIFHSPVSFCLTCLAALLFSGCTSQVQQKDLATEFFNLGNAYFELQKYDKAIEYYMQAIELDDTLIKANYNLARVYIEKNDFNKAQEILRAIILIPKTCF